MKTVAFSTYCYRRIIHFPLDLLRFPARLCQTGFCAIARIICSTEIKRGIRILDCNRKTRDTFYETIDSALALIERNDPRRFERVRREIRLIVYDRWQVEPLAPGAYARQPRVCMINLGRIDFSKRPKFTLAILAAMIVHEATHGYLCRKRLPYVTCIKERVEAVCRHEETRLLLR